MRLSIAGQPRLPGRLRRPTLRRARRPLAQRPLFRHPLADKGENQSSHKNIDLHADRHAAGVGADSDRDACADANSQQKRNVYGDPVIYTNPAADRHSAIDRCSSKCRSLHGNPLLYRISNLDRHPFPISYAECNPYADYPYTDHDAHDNANAHRDHDADTDHDMYADHNGSTTHADRDAYSDRIPRAVHNAHTDADKNSGTNDLLRMSYDYFPNPEKPFIFGWSGRLHLLL